MSTISIPSGVNNLLDELVTVAQEVTRQQGSNKLPTKLDVIERMKQVGQETHLHFPDCSYVLSGQNITVNKELSNEDKRCIEVAFNALKENPSLHEEGLDKRMFTLLMLSKMGNGEVNGFMQRLEHSLAQKR